MGFTKSKTNRIQRGGPFRSFTVFVAVFVVTMFSAILTHAQPTVISTNTTLDSTVMDFDGQDLVVSNCTLTITAGTHSFTSVLMTNSAQIMLQGTNGTIQNTTIAGSTNDTSIIVSNGILDGVTVNGILDVGNSIFGANLVATNGLTVNGTVLLGNLTNNSFGQIDFAGSQTLGGNGIVVFGLEPTFHNALYSHIDGASMTIGPSMTIRGQNGMIGYSFNPILSPRATTNMFVVNQGTIIADVSGGIIEIRSQITNQGTLSWSAGNLSLETPTVYNTGQIFAIGTTNVGTLKAVLISGGTIGLSNGPPVVIQNFVYFDAVTIKGTLDVGNTYSTTVLSVTNGLTLNGTILLGNPTNSNVGTLGFKGNQTLGGNGTVILGNSSNDGIISFRSGVTLTIGPGITIHGQAGNIGYNTYSLGTILSVINKGTITADVSS